MDSMDNIIVALERNDRVREIELISRTGPELGYVTNSAAMQNPFSELRRLQLWIVDDSDGPGPRNRTTSAST